MDNYEQELLSDIHELNDQILELENKIGRRREWIEAAEAKLPKLHRARNALCDRHAFEATKDDAA